jgi:transposase-like protein
MAKKTSRVRRTFTPQFKKDAVALIRGGRSVTEVAHDLGIRPELAPALAGAARAGSGGRVPGHRVSRKRWLGRASGRTQAT